MTDDHKKLPAAFYHLPNGAEPVRDWLKGLDQTDRQIIGFDLRKAEYSWPVGMPLCRPMGGGLWEIRSNLPHGRIARVIFCIGDGKMVLLHGFEKKTQETPKSDLEMARRRQKDTKR